MTTNEPIVTVEIIEVTTMPSPPTSEVTFRVHNHSGASIRLVDDGWFTWRKEAEHAEISLKRERLEPSAQVFGYFVPQVSELTPGQASTPMPAVPSAFRPRARQ